MNKYLNLLFVCLLSSISPTWSQQIPTSTWYNLLPACPCKNPDYNGAILRDGWAKDKGNLEKYHRGAVASFRSYPPVKTSEGPSCQQCCYSQNGDLIKSGRGAGTPDKKSTCRGEDKHGMMKLRLGGLIAHYRKDVKPWNNYIKADTANGWVKYNAKWVPNQGMNCP